MERPFKVMGWDQAAARVVERTIVAATRESARRAAEASGLRYIVVAPTEPDPAIPGRVEPDAQDEDGTRG